MACILAETEACAEAGFKLLVWGDKQLGGLLRLQVGTAVVLSAECCIEVWLCRKHAASEGSVFDNLVTDFNSVFTKFTPTNPSARWASALV